MLHCRIFRATCLATTLGNKLHEPLHSVIYLETAQIIAKQAAAIVDETRIEFLQGFQPLFSALHSEHSHLQLVSQFLFLTTPNLYYCELYNVTHSFAINITRTSCAKRYLVEYHLKPAAYRRKQLSKLPAKSVCSAVSFRVRNWEFRHARPRGKYLSCLIFLVSKGRFITVCGERVNRA